MPKALGLPKWITRASGERHEACERRERRAEVWRRGWRVGSGLLPVLGPAQFVRAGLGGRPARVHLSSGRRPPRTRRDTARAGGGVVAAHLRAGRTRRRQ